MAAGRRGTDPFILFKDAAGAWCAAPPGFRDSTVDPTGWGPTRATAIASLLTNPEFQQMAWTNRWPIPGLGDFLEVKEPDCARPEAPSCEPGGNFRAALRRQSFKVISNI